MKSPRILFVFSADYGEIVNADLFCREQPFEVAALFPERSVIQGFPPAAALGRYRTARDIAEQTARFDPELVVLASAYLYVVNDTLRLEEVEWLVRLARREGWRLATTDPWMGYWRCRPGARFNLFGFGRGAVRGNAEAAMRRQQDALDRVLDGVAHLYATPYQDPERASYSFFNSVPRPPAVDAPGADALFVLSGEDYRVQKRKQGARLHERLSTGFRHLLDSGFDSVTLVAPDECSRRVARLSGTIGIRFPGYTDLETFRTMIEKAALVGYWNFLSTSLLYAYYARKPIVFLDSGHQAELSDGLLDHIVQSVYDGRHPSIQRLEDLDGPDAGCRFDRLRTWIGRGPSDIVDGICHAHAPT